MDEGTGALVWPAIGLLGWVLFFVLLAAGGVI